MRQPPGKRHRAVAVSFPAPPSGGRKTHVTEDLVQDNADGVGHGEGDDAEELGQPDGVVANGQRVSAADALRHNLAKDDNTGRGA